MWQELEMVMCSRGKGKVGAGAHGEREKEREGAALIGVGRIRAWGLGTELNFAVAEKSATK